MSEVERIDLARRVFDALRPAMTPHRVLVADESWDVGEQTEAVAMALESAVGKQYPITEQTAADIKKLADADDSPSASHLSSWLADVPRVAAAGQ
jgi:pyruvate kinase